MSGPIMKRSLGQNNFSFIFPTFLRDTTTLRATLVENVKKVQNQPTLLYTIQDGHQSTECGNTPHIFVKSTMFRAKAFLTLIQSTLVMLQEGNFGGWSVLQEWAT
jgi:hypothetical protein